MESHREGAKDAKKLSDRTGQRAGSEIGGVPPYPGSNPVEGGAKLSFGGIGEIAGQEYLTSDPVDKVVAFYKDKFGEKLSIIENQGHFRLALYDVHGSGATTIDVEQDGEGTKTKIFIAHIGK